MKNTLTPGDPGSDVSPFFTPEKPKPAKPAEKKAMPAPEPIRREPPSREPLRPEPARREPEPRQPVRHEPAKREAVPQESKDREASVIASADIFQGIAEPKEKKGFPTLIVIGLVIVALAAAGFILLRPKRSAAVEPAPQESSQALSPANQPAAPVEEAPKPVVKPAPARQKAQPQTKPADPGQVAADAILPAGPPAAALPMPGTPLGSASGNDRTSSGTSPLGADPAAAKAEETASPATKTEANPPPTIAAGSGTASDPSLSTSAPVPAPVNEGDLIDLGAVTEPPKLVKTVDPLYPQSAQRVGRVGQITVNALIDEKGNVIDTGILKGIQDDRGLGRAAELAVRKWKFQPARKDGVAVKVWKSFVIAFKADTNPASKME
jgi:protein TonB